MAGRVGHPARYGRAAATVACLHGVDGNLRQPVDRAGFGELRRHVARAKRGLLLRALFQMIESHPRVVDGRRHRNDAGDNRSQPSNQCPGRGDAFAQAQERPARASPRSPPSVPHRRADARRRSREGVLHAPGTPTP